MNSLAPSFSVCVSSRIDDKGGLVFQAGAWMPWCPEFGG